MLHTVIHDKTVQTNLLSSLLPPQRVLLRGLHKADGDVVDPAVIEHHQRVGLLCVLTGALPHHERPVLKQEAPSGGGGGVTGVKTKANLDDCAIKVNIESRTLFERINTS